MNVTFKIYGSKFCKMKIKFMICKFKPSDFHWPNREFVFISQFLVLSILEDMSKIYMMALVGAKGVLF